MKTVIKYISVLLLTLHFLSCEKYVELEMEDIDKAPKLVVGCYISPQDTLINVSVSKSIPLYQHSSTGWLFDVIKTATVTISDDSISRSIPFNAVTNTYILSTKSFPIIAGKTYKLQVISSSYPTVYGTTTVPLTGNNTLKVDSQTVVGKTIIKTQWQDKAGEKNYYRLIFVGEKINKTTNSITSEQIKNYTIYDNNNDGKLLEKNLEVKFSTPNSPVGYDRCSVYLFSINKSYYDFYQSIEMQSGSFLFETLSIYSNIENGLGIFTGYNGCKVQLK
jgi:hypothetical protein